MSGEHGDGRARSELLPRMYSPQAIALMQQAKRILDPGNLLNPGVLVEPAPVRRRPATGRAHAPGAYDAEADPRLRLVQGRRPSLHRRRQVHRRQHRLGRRDVPVVPRHPGGEGLDPWPRARPPGRRQRHPRLRRPGRRRRARPLPVLQGLRPRLPDRHRHGDLQVRGPVAAVPPQAAPPLPLRARPAPALGPDDPAEAGQRDAAQQDGRPGRQGRCRCRPTPQPAAVLRATAACVIRTERSRPRFG